MGGVTVIDNFDSSCLGLLECLREFTRDATGQIIMPTRVQKAGEEPGFRAADVYLMRLPDSRAAAKKAPYILHQLLTARDGQPKGKPPEASAVVRSIFCVYSADEQEGGLMLLNLMERLRIALLRDTIIGRRYRLDMEAGAERLIYPDDTAPYFAGEMITTWKIPAIEREVREWL